MRKEYHQKHTKKRIVKILLACLILLSIIAFYRFTLKKKAPAFLPYSQNASKVQSAEKKLKKPTIEGALIRDAYKKLRDLYSDPKNKIVNSNITETDILNVKNSLDNLPSSKLKTDLLAELDRIELP